MTMNYLLILAIFGALLNWATAFEYIPDYNGEDPEGPIDNPFWDCYEDSDCEPQEHCVDEFGMKLCMTKPTTTTSTTRTTTTTTTKPPPTSCAPPPKTESMSDYICFNGHNKDSTCFVTCQGGTCMQGDPMTKCKCDANSCWWTGNPTTACKADQDQCQTNSDCFPPQICADRCGKKCIYEKEEPEECDCHSDRDCKSNQVCEHEPEKEEEECGKCKTICSRPCGFHDSCDEGYICKHLSCGRECVALPKLPSCPFLNPGSYPRPNCRFANTCSSNDECQYDGVCCYSTECGRNICLSQDETNECVDKEDKVCSSSADCSPREICREDSEGCNQCSQAFSCPTVEKHCSADANCQASEVCIPNRDGCLTCQIAPEVRPAEKCEQPTCVSDDVCPEMHSCVRRPDGCKVCEMEDYY